MVIEFSNGLKSARRALDNWQEIRKDFNSSKVVIFPKAILSEEDIRKTLNDKFYDFPNLSGKIVLYFVRPNGGISNPIFAYRNTIEKSISDIVTDTILRFEKPFYVEPISGFLVKFIPQDIKNRPVTKIFDVS